MDYHSQVVCPNGKIWTFVPKVNMYYRSQYVCPNGKIWSIVPKVKLDYRSQICPNGKIGTIVPKGKMDCRSQVVSPSGKKSELLSPREKGLSLTSCACPKGKKNGLLPTSYIRPKGNIFQNAQHADVYEFLLLGDSVLRVPLA